jgi:23S rRNA U2552 (ribose-2'-O)-methylase RlmE/FtsJ
MKTLTELCLQNAYDTDKYDLGYIDNLYDPLFKKYKNKSVTLLEIGVQRGGSIFLWNNYFNDESSIYTLDIQYCNSLNELNNVTQNVKDAYNYDTVNEFSNNMFDIIIDDGPHTFDSFEFLIKNYFDKLKPKGLMIIEDIINIQWTPKLTLLAEQVGYSNVKVHNMNNKQKTIELSQMWSAGLDIIVLTK